MVSPAHIIVVRHGQTHWNAGSRWQGWLDSPLTSTGREQALAAARVLDGVTIDAAYSSDSGRALATATLVLADRNGPTVPVIPVFALRERNYGMYEGLTSLEIDAKFPHSRFDPTRHTRQSWVPPGGETLLAVSTRLTVFLDWLAAHHAGQSVLLTTHSGVVRCIDALARRQPLDAIWERHPPNGCVYRLELAPGPTLAVIDDMCEPPGAAPTPLTQTTASA